MKPPFLRTAYNYDTDAESLKAGLTCNDPTLTQQQFKEECDINTIVHRFHLTGQLPQFDKLPEYADYEGVFDFQTAMNAVRAAQESFMLLPADLRAKFNNDPQRFLDFTSNKDNLEEAARMGILNEEAMARVHAAAEKAEDERSAARAMARAAKDATAAAPAGNVPQGQTKEVGKTGKKHDS